MIRQASLKLTSSTAQLVGWPLRGCHRLELKDYNRTLKTSTFSNLGQSSQLLAHLGISIAYDRHWNLDDVSRRASPGSSPCHPCTLPPTEPIARIAISQPITVGRQVRVGKFISVAHWSVCEFDLPVHNFGARVPPAPTEGNAPRSFYLLIVIKVVEGLNPRASATKRPKARAVRCSTTLVDRKILLRRWTRV